jgi:DNA-binding XRE family transcriptional regulator
MGVTFMPRSIECRSDETEMGTVSSGVAQVSRGDTTDHPHTSTTMDRPAYDPILKQLGSKIRTIREELHLSQAECAAMCQVDRAHISRLERGFPNTSVLHLAKLAQGLGVEIVDLFKP